jgi:hypothetical protein
MHRRTPSSAAAVASTSSAYDVISISLIWPAWFVIETRRTSASSSDDTAISSIVVIGPTCRVISARPSEKETS